jgi:hypothetical protein
VSIDEQQMRASRELPAYRAGVWALRAMVLCLVVFAGFVAADADGETWALIAYLVAMTAGFVLLDRAGVRIFGFSEGIWKRRKMVYRDVFGLGS